MSSVSQKFDKLDAWSARFEDKLNRRPGWYLFLFSLLYLGVTVPVIFVRPMWFDELITFYTVRVPTLHDLWLALRAGVDLNPPLFHLFVRASEKVLGQNAIALRLPSLIAYWVMSVALFLLMRQRVGALYAAIAALFPLATGAYPYAYEGRPYAIILACCVFSLACWLAAVEGRKRNWALAGLMLSIAVAVSDHYYASLVVLPIAAGELVRSWHSRKIDWPVWGALALGGMPLLVFLPLVRGGMAAHKDAYVWNKPTVEYIWGTYSELLRYSVFPALLIMIWALLRSVRMPNRPASSASSVIRVPAHELAAALTLCSFPLIAFVLAETWVGMISPRYAIFTVIGFAVMFAFSSVAVGRGRKAPAFLLLLGLLGLSAVTMGLAARNEVEALHRFDNRESEPVALALNLPILVQDSILELPMDYYTSPRLHSRLIFPLALDDVHRHSEASSGEKLLMVIARNVFPIRTEDLAQFRREHKRYLVYGLHVGWLIATAMDDGAHVRMVFKNRWQILFLVEEKSGNGGIKNSSMLASAKPQAAGGSARIGRARQEAQP